MILGITGGTGCGKTTLLKLIEQQGGLVLDCDAIYHELLRSDERLLGRLEDRFPAAFAGGALNRKKLGEIVFSDEKALLELNAITHSAVRQEVLRRLAPGPALAAIDAIALFEGNLAELCQVTVAVTAPVEIRVKRLMARDRISEDYARKRIAAQHDDAWFCSRCTHVLENAGTEAEFCAKCIAFLGEIGIMK